MTVKIRAAVAEDRAEWDPLWVGYQQYYEVDLAQETEQLWARLMRNDPDGPLCLVAEQEGKLIGFTHYLFHDHTWSPKKRIYLVDLYTDPQSRGNGVGRALIEAVYKAADDANAESVYWLTQDFNHAGRALYDKVAKLTPFIKYVR